MTAFTGVKDTDLLILSHLNDRDLLSTCLVNRYVNRICQNEDFWRNRYISRYGRDKMWIKPDDISWKDFYLKVLVVLDNLPSLESYTLDLTERIPLDLNRILENDDILFNLADFGLGKKIDLYIAKDRYQDLLDRVRVSTGDDYLTVRDIMLAIYEYYDQPVTKEEYEEHLEVGNPYAEDIAIEDIEAGKIKRYNLLGLFFEGIVFRVYSSSKIFKEYEVIYGS